MLELLADVNSLVKEGIHLTEEGKLSPPHLSIGRRFLKREM